MMTANPLKQGTPEGRAEYRLAPVLHLLITRIGFAGTRKPGKGKGAVGGLGHDLAKAARGGSRLWADVVRAVAELALARVRHALTAVRDLPLRAPRAAPAILTPAQQALVERVTYVVPRIGRRLPWRSDCLVQALAARR